MDSCCGPSRTQYFPAGEVDLEVLDGDSVDLEVLEETVALELLDVSPEETVALALSLETVTPRNRYHVDPSEPTEIRTISILRRPST
jgi:hypothetical protein